MNGVHAAHHPARLPPFDILEETGNFRQSLLKDIERVAESDPDITFHIERTAWREHHARRLDEQGTKVGR